MVPDGPRHRRAGGQDGEQRHQDQQAQEVVGVLEGVELRPVIADGVQRQIAVPAHGEDQRDDAGQQYQGQKAFDPVHCLSAEGPSALTPRALPLIRPPFPRRTLSAAFLFSVPGAEREADLSAVATRAQAPSRLPFADGHQERSEDRSAPPRQGPQAPDRLSQALRLASLQDA